jgi:hypothetical protein
MRTTNRLISLFAAILFSATMLADVVYEPLIVDSGFNRDVIAEALPVCEHAVSYLYAGSPHYRCYYSMATTSVINAVNSGQIKAGNITKADSIKASSTGWPDDPTHDDANRVIRCIEDAKDNDIFKNVFWQLAPYDEANALCLRPDEDSADIADNYSNQGKGTLKFKKVGCYQKLYFLIVSPKLSCKSPNNTPNRGVHAQVHYTDGTSSEIIYFKSIGLSGQDYARVCKTNIYEGVYKKNTNTDPNTAYACAYEFSIDPTKLIASIEFENKKNCTGSVILGVTGMTADVEAPKEGTAQVTGIENNKFTISWDEVPDAETYRVDVATDEDFQHMVEGYNNRLVTKNDTIVQGENIEEDTDYYWRVRAVDSEGGQSASSAPKRVKTAGGEIPETAETNEDIESDLIPHLNILYSTFKINRTLWRDGYYNTLCLPFNMTPGEIAVSPLAGATVYKYVRADKIGNNQLNIEVADTTGIRAGVPYLIQWPDMGDIIPAPLEFHNVTISSNVGQTIGGPDEIRFVGNIGIATLVEEDDNNLFLGANNVLYWPNKDQNRMKGFRAYFQVPTTGANAVKKNTPARIVTRRETPTDIDQISNQQSPFSNKILRNGQILIIRDGQTYNLLGGKISPKP